MRGPTLETGAGRTGQGEGRSGALLTPLPQLLTLCGPRLPGASFLCVGVSGGIPAGVGTRHDTLASEVADFASFFSNAARTGSLAGSEPGGPPSGGCQCVTHRLAGQMAD